MNLVTEVLRGTETNCLAGNMLENKEIVLHYYHSLTDIKSFTQDKNNNNEISKNNIVCWIICPSCLPKHKLNFFPQFWIIIFCVGSYFLYPCVYVCILMLKCESEILFRFL